MALASGRRGPPPPPQLSTVAIVVAAGAGVRMGAGPPKALLPLAGRPMVAWSVAALERSGRVDRLVVVGPGEALDQVAAALGPAGARAEVVAGGSSRSRSVRAGVEAAGPGAERLLVHDAARPLLGPELVAAVLDGLEGVDGAIAAAPVADTLKRAGEDGTIDATVARAGLWAAQTPQAFHAPALRAAIAAAEAAGRLDEATDCAALIEWAGGRVRLVPTGAPNLKVTTPADLLVAEALLGAATPPVA